MSKDLNGLVEKLFEIVPYCLILLILMVLAWIALRLLRAHLSKTELRATDYLETFQKLHEEGKLTKEEFRIIRRLLSQQISRSLNDSKLNFSLLNQRSPSPPKDSPSGNIPKN